MKSFTDKLKEINDKGLIPFLIPKYVIKKYIFWIALILIGCLGVYIMYINQFDFKDGIYIKCPNASLYNPRCENPFYNAVDCPNEELCNIEYFNAGDVFGEKPSWLLTNYGNISFLTLLFALLLNHFLFNRGFKIEEGGEENENNNREH